MVVAVLGRTAFRPDDQTGKFFVGVGGGIPDQSSDFAVPFDQTFFAKFLQSEPDGVPSGSEESRQFPFTGHLKCFDAFADSLEGGAPYPIPGEEARKSVALIEAIYKSAGIWPEGT